MNWNDEGFGYDGSSSLREVFCKGLGRNWKKEG